MWTNHQEQTDAWIQPDGHLDAWNHPQEHPRASDKAQEQPLDGTHSDRQGNRATGDYRQSHQTTYVGDSLGDGWQSAPVQQDYGESDTMPSHTEGINAWRRLQKTLTARTKKSSASAERSENRQEESSEDGDRDCNGTLTINDGASCGDTNESGESSDTDDIEPGNEINYEEIFADAVEKHRREQEQPPMDLPPVRTIQKSLDDWLEKLPEPEGGEEIGSERMQAENSSDINDEHSSCTTNAWHGRLRNKATPQDTRESETQK